MNTMNAPRFGNLTEMDAYANPPLMDYLSGVQKQHGYVHLLGSPDRRDRRSIPIEFMFVPFVVAEHPLDVDSNPRGWEQCGSIFTTLEHHKRVLLLGDPGSGKTALFDYLVWSLTFAERRTPFTNRFGWVLPVPIALCDLALGSAASFNSLLDAFVSQPIGEPLKGGVYLRQMLEEGRALLVLDGINELGGKGARERLRDAVFDGMRRFPDCLWLLASRIVGYSEVPFEGFHGLGQGPSRTTGSAPFGSAPMIAKRYVAPFDQGRMRQFVHNWYAQRDPSAVKAGRHIDLAETLRKEPALRRLARIPNTLALMALTHRAEAVLPHERSLLYERITDAHFGSIDKQRSVRESVNDPPRNRMWLARVGYEMQRRRQSASEGELLARCEDVLDWIGCEMVRSKVSVEVSTPQEFLSFVSRRSGLLVPKTNDRYAFCDISFQEYFAAVALASEVTGFKWAKEGRAALGFNRTDVAAWARQGGWLETFAFLFEMLAGKPEWHSELLECVFGKDFSLLAAPEADEELFNLGLLAVRLLANPYSGLGPSERANAIEACVATQIRCSNYFHQTEGYGPDTSLFRLLMAANEDRRGAVMASIHRQWPLIAGELQRKILDFRGVNGMGLTEVAKLRDVEALILADTDVSDVQHLTELDSLDFLELDGTAVEDVAPLASMQGLKFLNLERTRIQDIAPLAHLHQLEALLLSGTPVSEEATSALQEALPNCDIVKEY